MKLRLISEAYNDIKEQDKNTALTLYGLKRLVKEGVIPSVKIGTKTLIDISKLPLYLEGKNPASETEILDYGSIRKVGGYNG